MSRFSLNRILSRLVHESQKSAPLPKTVRLKGGLVVRCQIVEGETVLTLARHGVEPSETELMTVLDRWPYDPPPSLWDYYNREGWFFLVVQWPTPAAEYLANPA